MEVTAGLAGPQTTAAVSMSSRGFSRSRAPHPGGGTYCAFTRPFRGAGHRGSAVSTLRSVAKLRDHSKLHLLGMPGRCLPTRSLDRPSPRPWPTEDGGRHVRRREGRVAKQIVAFSQTPTISPARPSVWWHFSAKETRAAAAVRTPRGIPRTFILRIYLLLRKANEGLFLISNLLICSLQKT